MKKILFISLVIILSISGVLAYRQFTNRQEKLEIVDLTKIERGERWNLLDEMTGINREAYDRGHTFQLDDKDPISRVVVGSYQPDYQNEKPGGIILLKRLPDGKDAIYWEITSPLFGGLGGGGGGGGGGRIIDDINNDGMKEIITSWKGARERIDYNEMYWILSLDPKTKTYKVLNNIVDKDKNVIHDFNFEHPNPPYWQYLNRFQTNNAGEGHQEDLIQDLDHDGISEIVVQNPGLEWFGDIRRSATIPTDRFTQIYKWDSVKKEYYLWKETTEPVK